MIRLRAKLRGLKARFLALPLLWRAFTINAGLLAVAFLVFALTPATVSHPIELVEATILLVGLAASLVANVVLLKPAFRPVTQLAEQMRTVDLLHPGQRVPVGDGSREIGELVTVFNQMLERLETERRASGQRVIAAQEAERFRISRDLHDGVGQILTGVLLQLNVIADSIPERQRMEVSELQQALHQALDETRRIARELRPEVLEHLGLVSALTELTKTFSNQSRIRAVARFAPDLPRLSPQAELAIYRIAQESLANAGRHSAAKNVELGLERHDDDLLLRIRDDGRGFQPDAEPDRHGGIQGMRERAAFAGGRLAVVTPAGGGVEVTFTVPTGT